MKCIQFQYEKKYIKDFLKLPKMLYDKENNMEDSKEIESILLDKHMLTTYIDKLYKFVVYDDNNKIAARFAITTYADDKETCYFGFFECIKNDEVAKYTFDEADRFIKGCGFKRVEGPVDLGMWHKYRLKIDRFDLRPYTGEPYNKDYYYEMFLNNGYVVKDKYYSDAYDKPGDAAYSERFVKRLEYFKEKGYVIKSPNIEEWDRAIEDVYGLIMKMYKNFNTFRELKKDDFLKLFGSYKSILNLDLVKLAYYENKAVGFIIGIPNYNNRVYHLKNLKNLLEILKIKKRADEYLVTYMAVDDGHRGLGRALAQLELVEINKKDATFVGALIKEGTATSNFVREVLKFRYNYVLMEKNLD